MATRRILTFLVPVLLAGPSALAEPPVSAESASATESAELRRAFNWELSMLLPSPGFKTSDWRSWIAAEKLPKRVARSRSIPGATVEVVDWFVDAQKERVMELNATWAPVLAKSFQLGWQNPYTGQMLSEFMGMHGADFRPPTVPSVFYNCLIPYWVQQGMRSASGSSWINVTASQEPRHMMLYPGRR